MKIPFIICLFCFVTFYGQAQPKKTVFGDTTFWYGPETKTQKSLKLPPLISSADAFHFRFSIAGQIADIWTSDLKSLNGSVTSYTRSYAYDEKKHFEKNSRLFSATVVLDTAVARKAYYLAQQIAEIPGEREIKSWKQGLDGEEYIFETSNPSTYNFKTYWTPSAQDTSLQEVKAIRTFITDFRNLLGLRDKHEKFTSALKPGQYANGSGLVMLKFSSKQTEKIEKMKPYRDYLHSIKDTLNNFLSDTLTKIFSHGEPVRCYNTFLLQFSADNVLRDVTTADEITDKEDKKEFKSCKKKIIDAFKLFKIDFVHSKIAYIIKLEFGQGKVEIYEYGPLY